MRMVLSSTLPLTNLSLKFISFKVKSEKWLPFLCTTFLLIATAGLHRNEISSLLVISLKNDFTDNISDALCSALFAL